MSYCYSGICSNERALISELVYKCIFISVSLFPRIGVDVHLAEKYCSPEIHGCYRRLVCVYSTVQKKCKRNSNAGSIITR